jgi:hypothetical protein
MRVLFTDVVQKSAIKHPNFDKSLPQQRNPNVLVTELFQEMPQQYCLPLPKFQGK